MVLKSRDVFTQYLKFKQSMQIQERLVRGQMLKPRLDTCAGNADIGTVLLAQVQSTR